MPFTSFSAGQTVTAALLNAALNGIAPVGAFKTADESVTANITPQNDDELFVTVAANKTYAVLWYFAVTAASNTPDFRQDFDGPTGFTLPARTLFGQGTAATSAEGTIVTSYNAAAGTDDTRGVTTSGLGMLGGGLLTVSSTAGTFRVRWAQTTSDAGAVTVKAGSWLLLIPLN